MRLFGGSRSIFLASHAGGRRERKLYPQAGYWRSALLFSRASPTPNRMHPQLPHSPFPDLWRRLSPRILTRGWVPTGRISAVDAREFCFLIGGPLHDDEFVDFGRDLVLLEAANVRQRWDSKHVRRVDGPIQASRVQVQNMSSTLFLRKMSLI